MKQAFRCATVLFLVSAFALALASTSASARYRHHHFGYHGFGYTSRAGIVKILGN
jgi:hypothetical protein